MAELHLDCPARRDAGNVARDRAMASGATHIEIAERDVDVPLSPLGARQARAVGRWFAEMPASQRPEIILTSPYARAVGTAEAVLAEGGVAGRFRRDRARRALA